MNQETTAKKTKSGAMNTRTMTMTAILAAISYILAFLDFPVPLSPSFAKMDLSDFPALIGAFAFGPLVGVLIELIKNALRLFATSTGGVGELANFLMGASYVFTAGTIYKFHKTKAMAWISCIVGSVVMGIVAAFTNYFILLPLFENFMPVDELIASFEEFIPFIHTKLDVIIFNAFPFNLLKGLVIGVFTMMIYKHLSPILKGKH
ncbi:MAG: ECF transporter S component [Oscillospiraceae bacterium]|nr:ECF transporter S component [Oscillospiraceae bacterium]